MENLFEMNFEKQQVDAISNLGLAHMGDCVFEILCRAYLCAQGNKTVDKLQRTPSTWSRLPLRQNSPKKCSLC